jgi:hypothetical protein
MLFMPYVKDFPKKGINLSKNQKNKNFYAVNFISGLIRKKIGGKNVYAAELSKNEVNR